MNKFIKNNIKTKILMLVLAAIIASGSIYSGEHKNKPNTPAPLAPIGQLFMQGNTINSCFRSDGIFNYDWVTFTSKDAGMIWPVTSPSRKTVNFTSGLWVAGKVNGQIRTAIAAYSSHFTPGNIPVEGQPTPSSVCQDPRWKIYYVQLTNPNYFNGGSIS